MVFHEHNYFLDLTKIFLWIYSGLYTCIILRYPNKIRFFVSHLNSLSSLLHLPLPSLFQILYTSDPTSFLLCHSLSLVSLLLFLKLPCPVGWDRRIHRLNLCRWVRPPPQRSVLDMTLNNLMVRFQQCWSFMECGIPLHYHPSQAHSGPEWSHLIGPYLWVK